MNKLTRGNEVREAIDLLSVGAGGAHFTEAGLTHLQAIFDKIQEHASTTEIPIPVHPCGVKLYDDEMVLTGNELWCRLFSWAPYSALHGPFDWSPQATVNGQDLHTMSESSGIPDDLIQTGYRLMDKVPFMIRMDIDNFNAVFNNGWV
jgi:hypothetical protein